MKNYLKYITLFSIPINFIWEMAQMPLYKDMPWDLDTALFCLVASFGDAVMILIIFFSVAFVLKNTAWILDLTLQKILLTVFVGIIIALLVERFALIDNMWSYSELMPIIPFDVGLSPILQMMVLPLLIFQIIKNRIVKTRE